MSIVAVDWLLLFPDIETLLLNVGQIDYKVIFGIFKRI